MSWLRRNWRSILAVIVTVFGLGALFLLYVMRKRAEVEQLRTELGLMNASMKVAGLEADRQARTKELAENLTEAAALDERIAAAKRSTLEIVQSTKGLSDAEVAEAFKRLGY